jgi:hypothetical protein
VKHYFEIDTLIAMFGVDKVQELDRIEFLGYHAIN